MYKTLFFDLRRFSLQISRSTSQVLMAEFLGTFLYFMSNYPRKWSNNFYSNLWRGIRWCHENNAFIVGSGKDKVVDCLGTKIKGHILLIKSIYFSSVLEMYAKLKDQMKNRRLVPVSFLSKIYKRRCGLILHADNSNTINTCV